MELLLQFAFGIKLPASGSSGSGKKVLLLALKLIEVVRGNTPENCGLLGRETNGSNTLRQSNIAFLDSH